MFGRKEQPSPKIQFSNITATADPFTPRYLVEATYVARDKAAAQELVQQLNSLMPEDGTNIQTIRNHDFIDPKLLHPTGKPQ